jgi:putative ABC transport system permease protein
MSSNINAIIIGVMNDIHTESFHKTIEPSLLWYAPEVCGVGVINMKINPVQFENSIESVRKIWAEISPDIPFEYHFLDESYASLYKSEVTFSRLIGFCSILSIFISCLGLFGLIKHIAKHRTKEIGIRKVNGARVSEIITMLNRDFVKWVAVAFVIATPIAWYSMHKWLENFAYKTELSWWIFALAGLLALGIALLTVSFQSWRAATRNPVEALRYE